MKSDCPVPRPRLGLLLPRDDPGARAVVAALGRDALRASAALDFVLLARGDAGARAFALAGLEPPPAADGAANVGAALELARGAGRSTCRLAPPGGADVERWALGLLDEPRALDGLVVPTPALPAGGPVLHVRRARDPARGAVRVVAVPDPAGVEGAVRAAAAALAALGVAGPRLVLFDAEGSTAALAGAAAAARRGGLDVAGPLEDGQAVLTRADAWVALLRPQARIPLALLGAGPETRLALDRPLAAAEPDADAVAAAVDLLQALARARGDLVAEREAARRPQLARAARPAAERCPYCRRALDEPPGGDSHDLAGPPAACGACGTAHHRDCLAEHGRCTVLGCKGTTVVRLGVELPFACLGAEAPRYVAFEPLAGDAGTGPAWLRVEASLDAGGVATERRLELELGRVARRGELVSGHLVVRAPRPFRARGAVLRLRATLTTRARKHAAAEQPIVHRQALLVGLAPASALGRLQDGVVALFAAPTGEAIPAGVRRYPFTFRLHPEHPATVKNRHDDVEETVTTWVHASLDGDEVVQELEVA